MAAHEPIDVLDLLHALLVEQQTSERMTLTGYVITIKNSDCDYLGTVGEVQFDRESRELILHTIKYDERLLPGKE